MTKKKRQSKIRESFFEALKYLEESQKYIYIACIIFVIAIIFGLITTFPPFMISFFEQTLKGLIQKISDLNAFELIVFIFKNNALVSFLSLFFGVFLGIFSFITLLSNGIILGYVIKNIILVEGFCSLWRILPHGIFELPAVLISTGLGLKLGMLVFSKNSEKEFLLRIKKSFFTFFFIVLPLLIIAAIIEGILIFLYK